MEYCDISYDEVAWKNYPSTSTKLNAENLNRMEQGIKNLVMGVTELRTLIGTDNLKSDSIIEAVNEIISKFGGYSGYNLLDMSLLEEKSTYFSISGTLEELGLSVNTSYTFSVNDGEEIYFYQYDADGNTITVDTVASGEAVSFTILVSCSVVEIMFPKTVGYVSEELCIAAQVMLEEGTEKHEYEPYTGGETMSDMWLEILENQNNINKCLKAVSSCEAFITSFSDLLEGSY